MHRTLRIVSVALALAAAACTGTESITGPQLSPTEPLREGIGYLGGGGRSSASAPVGTFAAP